MINTSHSRSPILIVGGGPVGLFLAHALSQLDVPTIVLEKYKARLGAPKAHALSPRSLEICRQFDISVPEIRSYPAPREEACHVRFVTNLSGEEIGSLPYERMSLDVLDATPEMLHNIAQPDFERLLEKRISAHPLVDIRRGWSWKSSEEITEAGSTNIKSIIYNTYTKDEETIYSSFVVACDGANSPVRQSLDIPMDAEESVETMMTIHFATDLRKVVGDKTGMLFWIMDPVGRGFIIAYDLGGNQVLIHNFDPRYHPIESFDDAKCRAVVTAAIGRDVPLKIHSHMPWLLRRQVADQFYKGRFVLAGDAAHAFPPTGGLGLNSGIGDAHCLAYKLASIYKGHGNIDRLLSAYHQERHPIADRNSKQSVTNGKAIFGLLKALKNTDPDVDVARASMKMALEDPENRKLVCEGIKGQTEHFDNLMLHIGYVYNTDWSPKNAKDFYPTYGPGARLAHAWITVPESSSWRSLLPPPVDLTFLHDLPENARQSKRFSTLDLVTKDSYTFISASGRLDSVYQALDKVAEDRGLSVQRAQLGIDFSMTEILGQAWLDGFRIQEGDGILVRPDQHILCLVAKSADPDLVVSIFLTSLGI